jgi:hypothetical protein
MRKAGNGWQLACAWSRKGVAFAKRRQPCWTVGLGDDDINFVMGKKLIKRARGKTARRCQCLQISGIV